MKILTHKAEQAEEYRLFSVRAAIGRVDFQNKSILLPKSLLKCKLI